MENKIIDIEEQEGDSYIDDGEEDDLDGYGDRY